MPSIPARSSSKPPTSKNPSSSSSSSSSSSTGASKSKAGEADRRAAIIADFIKQDPFLSRANDCIKIKLVRSLGDIDDDSVAFQPAYTHQHFGDDELIKGYQKLRINLYHTSGSMFLYLGMKHEGKRGSEDDTDLVKVLNEYTDSSVCTFDINTFRAKINEPFSPPGERILSYSMPASSDGMKERTFSVYRGSFADPQVAAYHNRVQIFILWFIDGGRYLELNDGRWDVYYLFEEHTPLDGCASNQSNFVLAGFCTAYRFFRYPNRTRFRVSQFLVLPPYQGAGNGRRLLQAIYDQALKSDHVADITVEDPNEHFQRLRDITDLHNLIENNIFPGLVSPSSAASTLSSFLAPSPTTSATTTTTTTTTTLSSSSSSSSPSPTTTTPSSSSSSPSSSSSSSSPSPSSSPSSSSPRRPYTPPLSLLDSPRRHTPGTPGRVRIASSLASSSKRHLKSQVHSPSRVSLRVSSGGVATIPATTGLSVAEEEELDRRAMALLESASKHKRRRKPGAAGTDSSSSFSSSSSSLSSSSSGALTFGAAPTASYSSSPSASSSSSSPGTISFGAPAASTTTAAPASSTAAAATASTAAASSSLASPSLSSSSATSTPQFSFGAPTGTPSNTTTTTTPSTSSTTTTSSTTATTASTSGTTPTTTPAATGTPAFSFGGAKPTSSTTTTSASTATPSTPPTTTPSSTTTSGFSFGSTPTPTTATTSFGKPTPTPATTTTTPSAGTFFSFEIGRASCRERV
eukprot:TRINITY_DN4326_c0_g1_i1.p1 TRINITY_DN4326_c0_g1~~TRINITY_DN4326_c0_g1_i1.p1  ORF type:complete len:869 (-),score=367.51 TRINITY_DN4326_c0_g1_i1:88-2325(-)